jgi:glycosyltransferase involved in cell wall biosynthesis
MNSLKRPPARVLFVQPALPAYRIPFFRELKARGNIELEVWCNMRGRGSLASIPTSEFRVVHFPERSLGPIFFQPALVRAAWSSNADVLVMPWNTRYVELAPALLLARLRRLPVLLWGHGYSKHETTSRRMLRNEIGKLASGIVVYSDSARERLLSEGFTPERAFVARNALDREPIERALRARKVNRRLESIRAEEKVILFSSRLEPDKRPGLLLEALALVRQRFEARLVVLGAGPLLEQLKVEAQELGVAPFVEFLGAEYEEANIAPWMKRAQVFAYPGAIGLSLLHAFHYSLPVVASDDRVIHNPEIDALVSGVNGATFRDGDAQDLARVLVELLSDEPRRLKLAKAALETVTSPDGYTMAHMVDGMEEAILGVTTQR